MIQKTSPKSVLKEPTPELQTESGEQILMQEWHCARCGHFLGRHAITKGIVQIKCRYCKEWSTLDVSPEGDDD